MNESDLPENAKPTILLVDDNADILTVIKLSLELLGYRVFEFSNGHDALEQFETVRPSIAIIDQGLPDLLGLDVGRRIRKLEFGKTCPLILLTGTDCPTLRDDANDAGFCDFLVKPVRINTLSDCIDRQIQAG